MLDGTACHHFRRSPDLEVRKPSPCQDEGRGTFRHPAPRLQGRPALVACLEVELVTLWCFVEDTPSTVTS